MRDSFVVQPTPCGGLGDGAVEQSACWMACTSVVQLGPDRHLEHVKEAHYSGKRVDW